MGTESTNSTRKNMKYTNRRLIKANWKKKKIVLIEYKYKQKMWSGEKKGEQ